MSGICSAHRHHEPTCPLCAAGGDRGDNTARCCTECYVHGCEPDGDCELVAGSTLLTPVPAADRQTDEERARAQRFPSVPPGDDIRAEHERFQQQQIDAHADAVMAEEPFDLDAACEPVDISGNEVARYRLVADLGAAITEYGELRGAIRNAVMACPATGVDYCTHTHEIGEYADAVLALPEMRALLDAAAKVQRVEALVARAGRFAINPAAVRAALGGEG